VAAGYSRRVAAETERWCLKRAFGDKFGAKLPSRVSQGVAAGQGWRLKAEQAGLPCFMYQEANALRNMEW